MKKLTAIALTALIASAAVVANAEPRERDAFEVCKRTIEMAGGGDVAVRLYGTQRSADRERVRLDVFPVDGTRTAVNCWVDADNGVSLQALGGVAQMVSVSAGDEQVTVVD